MSRVAARTGPDRAPNTFGASHVPHAALHPDMSLQDTTTADTDAATTTVRVRCTGDVRMAVGTHEFTYTFTGETLREFLAAFFDDYDVADLVIAETEADATAHGWAPTDGDPPGTWRKNPEGEQTRAFARIAVNGRFNEHLDGLDTTLEDGDRVALMKPFMFCC